MGDSASIRDKYIASICEECNGHGYVRTRHADEECAGCDGGGMTYERKAEK